uniref:Uncharacterized protein n=1 Tax=Caenorhabditis japonica TaxID=281687 RepID=A0A8R1E9Z6_CAEJA
MQWTSWFRYGFEALLVNQWSHVNDSKWSDKYRDIILSKYSFDADNFTFDIIGLSSIVVFFYVAGYVSLFLRIRFSR